MASRSPQQSCQELAANWQYHTNIRGSLKHKRNGKHLLSIQGQITEPGGKKWHHRLNVWTQEMTDSKKKDHMTSGSSRNSEGETQVGADS